MNIGLSGIEVAVPESAEIEHEAPTERVSAGFERLHSMLGGGVFRGSSTLITGAPRTAKTTLAAQISPNADTWIHLSYLIRGGERSRTLTIVKSRRTWHSNQVREVVLSDTGVSLTDVSTESGQVTEGVRHPNLPVTGSVQSAGQRRGRRNSARKSVKASAARVAK